MEINKKNFLTALSQIKAYKDVIVLKDSPIDGCLDIFYGPRWTHGVPSCVNKMTIGLDRAGADLFDDAPVEKLGSPILVSLGRVKGAVKDAQLCVLKDGCMNGIRVEVDKSDAGHSTFSWILDTYESYSREIKNITDFESVSLQKTDYSYMVTECIKFVSDDPTRYFMNGICFDFARGGKDYIHMVATDGRKLCLIKQAASHSEYSADSGLGQFIIPPAYLHVPGSDYNSVKIKLSNRIGQVLISTEDYHFEGLFACIKGDFPGYDRVIPEITEKTQWFTLCAASLRMTIGSVKSLMGRKDIVYLDAENPENMNITVADGQQTLEIEGTASRPMRLSFAWKHLSACLFDGRALTKFYLNGSAKAFLAHETKAVKGLTLDVTKLFMPTHDDEMHKGKDEFCIPLPKGTTGDGKDKSFH
jgi:DNA polymerase III sliding clamp (beta) subunit (PCNA family)